MADERLQIAASVVDQATPNLRKIQAELAKVQATPGMKLAREELTKLQSVIQGLAGATRINGGFAGALGLGIGGGLAAGAAGAIAALDQLARKTLELRHLSRETGLGANDIRAFEAIGKRFQIAPEAMSSGLQRFAQTFDEFRRKRGTLYGELQQKQPALAEQMVNEPDTKKALGLYLSFLSKIKDAQGQKQWADAAGLGGFERLFVDGADRFKKEWAEVVASIGRSTPEMVKQAQEFETAINRVSEALDRLSTERGGQVLGWFSTALESISATMKQRGAEVDWFIGKLGDLRKAIGSGADSDLSKEELAARREKEIHDLDTMIRGRESGPGASRATEERERRDKLVDELKKLREELERQRQGTAQKSAFDGTSGGAGGGFGGLIQNASFGGSPFAVDRAIRREMGGDRAFGMRGSYRLPRGGTGGVGPDGNPLPPVEAGAGPYKSILDHIARAEGTLGRGDYNASLGYGRFLPGGQEQELTSKSLNEISALGRYMRRQPGNPNSSALGRYQIVGDTMRRLMKRMRLSGSELFDPEMQDRMAAELARDTRGSPARLAREWASLRGSRLATAVDLFSSVGRRQPQTGMFPPMRTYADFQNATGAFPTPYPVGWPDRRQERPSGRLVNAAQEAGVTGPMKVDTSGKVGIDINLNGQAFAEGFKARATMDGIVGRVQLNRGTTMPVASNRE